MKGVVFTEFVDFVIDQMGDDVVDEMFEIANPPSGGAYTAVGLYDHRELIDLVSALSEIVKRPASELIRAFGRRLFARYSRAFPEVFEGQSDAFTLIEKIERHIHSEVLEFSSDAEAPRLETEREASDALTVRCVCCRPLGELCLAFVESCGVFFGERLALSHEQNEAGLTLRVTREANAAA